MFVAVMTLFNPNLNLVKSNYDILRSLDVMLKLFDNSEGESQIKNKLYCTENLTEAEYISEGENKGLGYAFNKCIFDGAFNANTGEVDFILLDQDTTLDLNKLGDIIFNYEKYKLDDRLGIYGGYPVRENGLPYKIKKAPEASPWPELITTMLVISSYSITPSRVFRSVGRFREDFFIDHIDYDYCWKCRNKGYYTVIDPKNTFTHSIGIGDVHIFGKSICPISSTNRSYYQVRNSILSYNGFGITKYRLIREIVKRFIVVFLTGVSNNDLKQRLKYAFIGLKHGIVGVGGKLK